VLQKTDEELFAEIKLGNKQAFNVLFERYYVALCRFIFKMLRNTDDSEEIVQSFFVNFWLKRKIIIIVLSVKSYLYQSVKFAMFNFLKAKKNRTESEQKSSEQIQTGETPDDFEETQKLKNRINKAVEILPEKCREIFLLSRLNGLTYREIAEYLEISVKTVENQMGTALKKIREYIKSTTST
jgi:RNA polymerase sigma-70 factor (ECF subfamily)